jgi:hypothetical protein
MNPRQWLCCGHSVIDIGCVWLTCSANAVYACNEAVTVPGQRLYVAGVLGRVHQSRPDLTDGLIEAVLKVHEGLSRPELLAQFLPRDDFPRSLHQQSQHLEGLFLQFELRPALAQLA